MLKEKIQRLGLKVAAVASAIGLYAVNAVKAVDPTLADVTTTFTGHVSTILTFVVAVLGAFIGAMLIPMGLRAIYRLVRRLLSKGPRA